MPDRIDNRDQRSLARELSRLLVNGLWDRKKANAILENDEKVSVIEDVCVKNGPLYVNADEREDLIKIGFSDTFIDELAGKDGLKMLRERVKYIAPSCVPTTFWLLRRSTDSYIDCIRELRLYGVEAKKAVPFILRALDDEDKKIRDHALITLTMIGAPSSIFKKMADHCRSSLVEARKIGNVRYSGCEANMVMMFENGNAKIEDVFSTLEYYFHIIQDVQPEFEHMAFANVLAKHEKNAVPFVMKLLDSGQPLIALEVLCRIGYRSEEIKQRLVELYHTAYSDKEYEMTIKTYAAYLLAINGDNSRLLKMVDILIDSMVANHTGPNRPIRHEMPSKEAELLSHLWIDAFEWIVAKIGRLELQHDDEESILNQLSDAIHYSGQIVPTLLELAKGDNPKLARFALKCLANITKTDALVFFDDVLAIAKNGGDPYVICDAIRVLLVIADSGRKTSVNIAELFSIFLNHDKIEVIEAIIDLLNGNEFQRITTPSQAVILLPQLERIIKEGKISQEGLKTASELKVIIEGMQL